jgi:hypothetical protein
VLTRTFFKDTREIISSPTRRDFDLLDRGLACSIEPSTIVTVWCCLKQRRWRLLPFIWLIIDIGIALAYIAAPWVILARLDFEWPDWLKDGIVLVILAVIWTGIALYLATQTVLWLGFVP